MRMNMSNHDEIVRARKLLENNGYIVKRKILTENEKHKILFKKLNEDLEKKVWYIDYGTSAGNIEFKGTVEQAMKKADDNCSHTQKPYTIKSDDGEAWIRHWVGTEYDDVYDEYIDIIDFGRFGWYTDWEHWELDDK